MEREQALRILRALANGAHPATGEQFAADSPYQHPDTVRALFESIRVMEGTRTAVRSPDQGIASPPGSTGSRWTPEEEARLVSAFDAGKSVDEIVRGHNRSRAAIEARLVRLGRLDPSAVTVPLRYPPKPPAGQPRQGG
ncbi:MAG: hypothetical protein OEP48_01735 [Betaproteobacteria bacterium]|nr:hypothetical protein [Betaproteobacteria bacterium]